MKVLTLTFALVAVSLVSFAQSDTVKVYTYVEEMTEKSYIMTTVDLIATENGTKGIKIMANISNAKELTSFIISQYDMGSACNENNTLIIKFIDGSKIKILSYNQFSCKNSYFRVPFTAVEQLKTLEIEKIYYQNGDSYESGTFPVNNPRYFIQLYKGL